MKSIQVIDGALHAVDDIFAARDEVLAVVFPAGQDVAFVDEVWARGPQAAPDPEARGDGGSWPFVV